VPSLFERSLFRIGNALAVTLPKPWIKYYKLKPGDRLDIITGDSDLIIRVKKEVRESINYGINLRKDLTE